MPEAGRQALVAALTPALRKGPGISEDDEKEIRDSLVDAFGGNRARALQALGYGAGHGHGLLDGVNDQLAEFLDKGSDKVLADLVKLLSTV